MIPKTSNGPGGVSRVVAGDLFVVGLRPSRCRETKGPCSCGLASGAARTVGETVLLSFAVTFFRYVHAARGFRIGAVRRLRAGNGKFERVGLPVMLERALCERELQVEILGLVDREGRPAQTIAKGANRVFEINDVCVKRMSHGLREAPLRQKSDSEQPWKDSAGHGYPYWLGCCSIQKRCRGTGRDLSKRNNGLGGVPRPLPVICWDWTKAIALPRVR